MVSFLYWVELFLGLGSTSRACALASCLREAASSAGRRRRAGPDATSVPNNEGQDRLHRVPPNNERGLQRLPRHGGAGHAAPAPGPAPRSPGPTATTDRHRSSSRRRAEADCCHPSRPCRCPSCRRGYPSHRCRRWSHRAARGAAGAARGNTAAAGGAAAATRGTTRAARGATGPTAATGATAGAARAPGAAGSTAAARAAGVGNAAIRAAGAARTGRGHLQGGAVIVEAGGPVLGHELDDLQGAFLTGEVLWDLHHGLVHQVGVGCS